MLRKIFYFIVIAVIVNSCNSAIEIDDKKNEIVYSEKYYVDLQNKFINEKVSTKNKVVELIDKYFYDSKEIKKSENFEITIGLLSSLKIHSSQDSILIFFNDDILKTDRGELDTNFCECSVLYTDLDTTGILFTCYKYGKIYSIMPIWDSKEMKTKWLR